MNAIDIVILVIIGVSVLWGLYRGFTQTLLKLFGGIISFAGAFALYPKLANALAGNEALVRTISNYTGSANLLGNLDLSSTPVSALTPVKISAILEKANLPPAISSILKTNLEQRVFAPMGELAGTAGDYVNQTLVSVSTNVICFLICFLLSFLIISILINLFRAVMRLPVLRAADSLAGGVMGFLLGVLLCLALFALMPLMESVIPAEAFRNLVAESRFGGWFENSGLIVSIMNRRLH